MTSPAAIPAAATGGPGGAPPRAGTAGGGEAAHRAASSIRRLGEAIDALADAVRAGQGDEVSPEEMAARLAGIWAMIADLDPAVAVRLRGYSPSAE